MIAICPAGPPKLMKPSLSQKRNASANETEGTAERVGLSNCSPSRRRIAQRQHLDAMRLNGGETACAPVYGPILMSAEPVCQRARQRACALRSISARASATSFDFHQVLM